VRGVPLEPIRNDLPVVHKPNVPGSPVWVVQQSTETNVIATIAVGGLGERVLVSDHFDGDALEWIVLGV
jgi:hypothetical protein